MMADSGSRYGLPARRWQVLLDEAAGLLVELARRGQTISYSQLSYQLKSARIHHFSYAMVGLLDDLSVRDAQSGRPLLATLVVRQSSGRPGPGYFRKTAAQHGTPAQQERFWQEQLAAVCAYWQGAAGKRVGSNSN